MRHALIGTFRMHRVTFSDALGQLSAGDPATGRLAYSAVADPAAGTVVTVEGERQTTRHRVTDHLNTGVIVPAVIRDEARADAVAAVTGAVAAARCPVGHDILCAESL